MASEDIERRKEFEERKPRVAAGAKKAERANRAPVQAQLADHAMVLAKVPATVFYYQAKPFVDAVEAVSTYYGLDGVLVGGDCYNFEAEAMGQTMIYGERSMPTIDFRDPLIKKPSDLSKIKVPDWCTAKRVPYQLELTRLSVERGVSDHGFCCAPFSLAVGTRTYPLLIRDMRKDPGFAHELFTFLVDEILSSYLRVIQDNCGVSAIYGFDAWSSFPNVTPQILEEWVLPYAERLQQKVAPHGISVSVRCADYCEERVERFKKEILFRCFDVVTKAAGAPAVRLSMGPWHRLPLEPVAEYLAAYRAKGVTPAVTAAVPASLLREGPVEAILEHVRRCIDLLGRGNPILIYLVNIAADTPPDHVHAAIAAAHTYGRLPIAENLDKLEVKLPKRESFEEFMKIRAEAG